MPNIPNTLSLLRIALIPVLIIVFLLPYQSAPAWAAGIFVVAALTDWLDGYLARKWDQTSPFGAFIDPVADKLIVAIALLLILYKTPTWYILLPVAVIIGREITVSALREWMAELGQRNAVKVSYDGTEVINENPQLNFKGGQMFFSGSTGWATNNHIFDNLEIFHDCQ